MMSHDDPIDDGQLKSIREHWDEDIDGEPLSRKESAVVYGICVAAAVLVAVLIYGLRGLFFKG